MTIYLVTQHYAPDSTSTAEFMTAIAEEIAQENEVVVLSGSKGATETPAGTNTPRVIEIRYRVMLKGALVRRGLAMVAFGLQVVASLIRRLRGGDIVIVVTTPFALPYFAVLAARIRGAQAVLIVYDLYPDVLVTSEIIGETSAGARILRWTNGHMLRSLAAIVVIGRDMEQQLLRYRGVMREKIVLIPNWATLAPGLREARHGNSFRTPIFAKFVVGLFGNLGFTHDPETVFEAARRLVGAPDIHFLLSGTGVGWERLKSLQQTAKLTNVTLVERVPEPRLEELLAAADVWILPYRRNAAHLSVPSRLYNLLAVGRPVIAMSEADTEHARTIAADDVGWVVPPGSPDTLAEAILTAARDIEGAAAKGRRALAVARRYSREASGSSYRALIRHLRSAAKGP